MSLQILSTSIFPHPFCLVNYWPPTQFQIQFPPISTVSGIWKKFIYDHQWFHCPASHLCYSIVTLWLAPVYGILYSQTVKFMISGTISITSIDFCKNEIISAGNRLNTQSILNWSRILHFAMTSIILPCFSFHRNMYQIESSSTHWKSLLETNGRQICTGMLFSETYQNIC